MHLRIQQFVREYLVDLNAAAAARRCGYPAHVARERGSKLMARKDVQAAVKQAMAARAERTDITADRVVREYARIAFADPRRLFAWDDKGLRMVPSGAISDDDAAAVMWVSTGGDKGRHAQRMRMHDKQRALDALSRHLGLRRDGRTTYDLRPDPRRIPPPRADAGKPAREVLIERLTRLRDAGDDELAREVQEAWRELVGRDAAVKR